MKAFQSDLKTKMLIALGLPDLEELHKDAKLFFHTDFYACKIIGGRKEKQLYYTYLVLVDCTNTYEDVIKRVNELSVSRTGTKTNINKVSTVETYRSRIVNKLLDFNSANFIDIGFSTSP